MPWVRVNAYQIKITLLGLKPPIWRRLLVRGDMTLDDLHWVIQVAMPWTNSHLHQFKLKSKAGKPTKEEFKRMAKGEISVNELWGERYFSDPQFELEETEDSTKITLHNLELKEKSKLFYTYDMGDSWEHEVTFEKVLPVDPKQKYPFCVTGKFNAPPDDCGGVWGYGDLIDARADPKHENHDDAAEILGEDFDPEHFDAAEVNVRLRKAFR